MTWFDIIDTITKLTKLDVITTDSCADVLECNFERTTPNRYRSVVLHAPFENAELISGNDRTILTLTLHDESPRKEYAMRISGLGKPIDIDIASPPMAYENDPKPKLGWERKYSLCYEIGENQVWFGIEVIESQKKLVSITLKR